MIAVRQRPAISAQKCTLRKAMPEVGGAWHQDGRFLGDWAKEIDGADAIVNLAGESIANGRWNDARKRDIWTSRVDPSMSVNTSVTTPPGGSVPLDLMGSSVLQVVRR